MNDQDTAVRDQAFRGNSHYNPISVDVKEATGTAFLGILAVMLLLALLLSQRQNRKLLAKLAGHGERPS